mgnify:CR=1 FL=1
MAIITPSDVIAGVHIVEPAMHGDERGFFFESFNQRDFQQATGLDVNFVQEYTNAVGATGTPRYYAVFDIDNFVLGPTPDSSYTTELHYYYRPTSITSGADSGTTWLSENAPNALLYGSLVEAYTYMKGEQDMMQLYEQRFVQEIQRLKDLAESRENSDAYRQGLPSRPRT